MKTAALCLAVLLTAGSAGTAFAAQPWCEGGERPLEGSLRLDQVFTPDSDAQKPAKEALKAHAFEPLDPKLAESLSVPEALRVPNAYLLRTAGYPGPSGMPTVEIYFDNKDSSIEVHTFSLTRLEKLENFAVVVVAPQPIKRLKSFCFVTE